MKSNFRTLVLASAVAAVAALATIPAVAATTTLKVPFSFTVNGHALPAGVYSVARDDRHQFVRLQSTTSAEGYTWVAIGNSERTDLVSLKFDADTHALRTVQYGALISPRLDKGSKSRESITPIEVSGR